MLTAQNHAAKRHGESVMLLQPPSPNSGPQTIPTKLTLGINIEEVRKRTHQAGYTRKMETAVKRWLPKFITRARYDIWKAALDGYYECEIDITKSTLETRFLHDGLAELGDLIREAGFQVWFPHREGVILVSWE